MAEHFPEIVGGTDKEKQEFRRRIQESAAHLSISPEYLVEADSETLREFEVAHLLTHNILKQYGVDPVEFPISHIHVVKEKMWPEELRDNPACYTFLQQRIFIQEGSSGIRRLNDLIHELLHANQIQKGQITMEGEEKDYRVGLDMIGRDGYERWFEFFNEAVTQTLATEATRFAMEYEPYKSEHENIVKILNRFVEEQDQPKDQEWFDEVLSIDYEEDDGSIKKLTSVDFTYQKERYGLSLLCIKIFERNQDEFESPEHVFKEFVAAAYKTNIMRLGKVIEKTFGGGTLRKLASETTPDEFVDLVNDL